MVIKMKMNLTLDSLALLLFCSDIIPTKLPHLSNEQWGYVENKIRMNDKVEPSRLFGLNLDALTQILDIDESIAQIVVDRQKLLPSLMHSLYNLESQGILITTKFEKTYPKKLRLLKQRMPLILFYYGDLRLLYEDGISILGPHIADNKLKKAAKHVYIKVLNEGYHLISQGNKGIDGYVLRLALKAKAKVILFVADHMFDRTLQYKNYVKRKQMLILCASDPYAYFNITNSLDRNTYICALSKAQIVIASHRNTGEAWFTSVQNLHYRWTTSLVLSSNHYYNGNLRLIEMGAYPLTQRDLYEEKTIDEIIEKYEKQTLYAQPIIDQMSIYEFINE